MVIQEYNYLLHICNKNGTEIQSMNVYASTMLKLRETMSIMICRTTPYISATRIIDEKEVLILSLGQRGIMDITRKLHPHWGGRRVRKHTKPYICSFRFNEQTQKILSNVSDKTKYITQAIKEKSEREN